MDQWRAQRRVRLREDKGLEAITPMWRNPHITRAYMKADKRSKKKEAMRWRRDEPLNLDIPHSLRGRRLPAVLFEKNWLAANRDTITGHPYYITIDEEPVAGWLDEHYPLQSGHDGDDEMDLASDEEQRLGKRRRTSTFLSHDGILPGSGYVHYPEGTFPQMQQQATMPFALPPSGSNYGMGVLPPGNDHFVVMPPAPGSNFGGF